MRSVDRFKQRYQKGSQSVKKTSHKSVEEIIEEGSKPSGIKAEEEKTEDFDFIVNGESKKPSKKFPIFYKENPHETPYERFERFSRQLNRAVCACSLCPRGLKDFQHKHLVRDPHFQMSVYYRGIVLIKYEPDESDINGLFDEHLPKTFDDVDSVYKTTVVKCAGEDECDCPFFKLELRAMAKAMPKLIVAFDDKTAKMFGADFSKDGFQTFGKSKVFCANSKEKITQIMKLISTPKTRNHLLS
jgi:hypothetical protein